MSFASHFWVPTYGTVFVLSHWTCLWCRYRRNALVLFQIPLFSIPGSVLLQLYAVYLYFHCFVKYVNKVQHRTNNKTLHCIDNSVSLPLRLCHQAPGCHPGNKVLQCTPKRHSHLRVWKVFFALQFGALIRMTLTRKAKMVRKTKTQAPILCDSSTLNTDAEDAAFHDVNLKNCNERYFDRQNQLSEHSQNTIPQPPYCGPMFGNENVLQQRRQQIQICPHADLCPSVARLSFSLWLTLHPGAGNQTCFSQRLGFGAVLGTLFMIVDKAIFTECSRV